MLGMCFGTLINGRGKLCFEKECSWNITPLADITLHNGVLPITNINKHWPVCCKCNNRLLSTLKVTYSHWNLFLAQENWARPGSVRVCLHRFPSHSSCLKNIGSWFLRLRDSQVHWTYRQTLDRKLECFVVELGFENSTLFILHWSQPFLMSEPHENTQVLFRACRPTG